MSLTVNGVWAAGVWAPTVWADGVWYEPAAAAAVTAGGGSSKGRKKKSKVKRWSDPVVPVDPAPVYAASPSAAVEEKTQIIVPRGSLRADVLASDHVASRKRKRAYLAGVLALALTEDE